MLRVELQSYLAELLHIDAIKDYSPNGLQIEGRERIQKIVTGVTASQALIDAAIAENADALLVHHGFFWKNEPEVITGMKQRRIKALLSADMNLFGYHLPLDVHPEFGNNAQLADLLGWPQPTPLMAADPHGVVMSTTLPEPMSSQALADALVKKLQRPLVCAVQHDKPISRIAWCTGGGQGYIDLAAAHGCDAFITGEVSEQTVHSAREQEISFFAAGHHATERYGILALGNHLAQKFGLEHKFIDIDNPA